MEGDCSCVGWSKLLARVVAIRLRTWFDSRLGLHQFGFRRGKGVDKALQVTCRLVEEVATSTDGEEGVELSFHDIEKAYHKKTIPFGHPHIQRQRPWWLVHNRFHWQEKAGLFIQG